MQIIERLAPAGHNCRCGESLWGFLGITVHNTSNYSNGANALAHSNLLRNGWKNKYISWHYVIDKDYSVRCIPENETAWCAGDGNGNGNRKTINIEICDNADGDIRAATDNAVELCADILRRHGIREARGHLFQHNHWTGKDCPYDMRRSNPYSWDTFVNKVQEKLNGATAGADQILYKGSKVKFDGVFKADIVKKPYSTNLFGCSKLTGISFNEYYNENGEFRQYHWIPCNDFYEVTAEGSTEGQDDIIYGGQSYVKNDSIYEVKDIDVPTNSAKLNINGRDVWVYSTYLYEVSNN